MLDIYNCGNSEDAVQQRLMVETPTYSVRAPKSGPLQYPRAGCTVRLSAERIGRPRGLRGPSGIREPGCREDANSMKQTREVRKEPFLAWRSEKEDTQRLVRSGCAHPVSPARSTCAPFPISSICNILAYDGRWTSSSWPLFPTSASTPSPPHFFSERVGRVRLRPVQSPWLSRALSKP